MEAINKFKAYFGMIPPEAGASEVHQETQTEKLGVSTGSPFSFSKLIGQSPFSSTGKSSANGDNPHTYTNGALAVDLHSMPEYSASKVNADREIVSVKPVSYADAKTIGENFRSGSPVIIDLVELKHEEAKRLVDFSAGLAFGLHGTLDKVATKIFLLSPAGVSISSTERNKFLNS